MSASEALIARTRLTYRWFAFANSQAELPEALLPAHWPGAAARRLFEELYDGLGPLAALRVAQHISAHDAALATGVTWFACTDPIDDTTLAPPWVTIVASRLMSIIDRFIASSSMNCRI